MKNLAYFKLAILLLFYSNLPAQVLTTNSPPYNTSSNLVKNVLLGSGVVATNIQFYGDSTKQLGFFKGSGTVVGLDSGIVLTTRNITGIPLGGNNGSAIPVGPNSGGFGPSWMGTSSNNNLLTVSASVPGLLGQSFATPNVVNDAAVLSFNFVPSSDTVEFNYVFASQEWNTYPCTKFNDMFGFFVSGPGINGTFNSPPGFPNQAVNVATFTGASGTTLPITVSSIHPAGSPSCSPSTALNANYFKSNMPTNVDIKFNGMTKKMTARFKVTPCDTYNIALAIAHAQDRTLQSAVFIEAKSFGGKKVEVNAKPKFNMKANDSTLYEGCGNVELEFKRFASLSGSAVVKFNVSGQAINGTDYAQIPDSVIFNAGASTTSLTLNINDDGINEGTESIIITIFPDTSLPCTPRDTQIVKFYLKDRPILKTKAIHDTIWCKEKNAFAEVKITNGVPDYKYLWGNGKTKAKIKLPIPKKDTMILVTVTDACKKETVVDTVKIHKAVIPPITIDDFNNLTLNCPGDEVLLSPKPKGGKKPYKWYWNTVLSSDKQKKFKTKNDTIIRLKIKDDCDTEKEKSVKIKVPSYPPLKIDLQSVSLFCIGRNEVVTSKVTGGNGVYIYKWNSNWPISNSATKKESTVLIKDKIGQVTLKITDECKSEATKKFDILAENCVPYKPNIFSPNGDGVNDFLYLIDPDQFPGTEVMVYNRWGKLVYHSTNYQNNWNGGDLSDGTYFYTMTLPDGRSFQSSVMIIR